MRHKQSILTPKTKKRIFSHHHETSFIQSNTPYRQIWFFLAPPKIIDITIESNSNEILKENEQIILKCTARGTPQPKIIWQISGKKIQSNKRSNQNPPHDKKKHFFWIDIIAYENKLLIKNLSRTTPVDYQCIADNGIPPRDTRTKRLLPSSE